MKVATLGQAIFICFHKDIQMQHQLLFDEIHITLGQAILMFSQRHPDVTPITI